MDESTTLPWHAKDFSGYSRNGLIEHWMDTAWVAPPTAERRRRMRTGLRAWMTTLGGMQWVRDTYGAGVANFAAHGQQMIITEPTHLDGAWQLISEYAAPLTDYLLALNDEAMKLGQFTSAINPRLTGETRMAIQRKLRDGLKEQMRLSIAAQLTGPDRLGPILDRNSTYFQPIWTATARRVIERLEEVESALTGPRADADRQLIRSRVEELANSHGRNPRPPAPTDKHEERALKLVEPALLKRRSNAERARSSNKKEGDVTLQVLSQAARESQLLIAKRLAAGVEIDGAEAAKILGFYIAKRKTDWWRENSARRRESSSNTHSFTGDTLAPRIRRADQLGQLEREQQDAQAQERRPQHSHELYEAPESISAVAAELNAWLDANTGSTDDEVLAWLDGRLAADAGLARYSLEDKYGWVRLTLEEIRNRTKHRRSRPSDHAQSEARTTHDSEGATR